MYSFKNLKNVSYWITSLRNHLSCRFNQRYLISNARLFDTPPNVNPFLSNIRIFPNQ